MVAKLTLVFAAFLVTQTKKSSNTNCYSVAEPRLPQTQKCMKHRRLKKIVRRNIGANTDDKENLYKKLAKCGPFFKTLFTISSIII